MLPFLIKYCGHGPNFKIWFNLNKKCPRFLRALFLRLFYAKIFLFNKFQDTLFLRQVGVKKCKSTVVKMAIFLHHIFFTPKFFLGHPGIKSEFTVQQ